MESSQVVISSCSNVSHSSVAIGLAPDTRCAQHLRYIQGAVGLFQEAGGEQVGQYRAGSKGVPVQAALQTLARQK